MKVLKDTLTYARQEIFDFKATLARIPAVQKRFR